MKKDKRKIGRWINHTHCSICNWCMEDDVVGGNFIVAFTYCPNCGSKMEVNDERTAEHI